MGGTDTANECQESTDPCATIQHAITVATAGDTIQVAAGTYTEHVTIPKSVTLLGPNAGVDPNTGSRVAEATIEGAVGTAVRPEAANVTVDGFTISSATGGAPVLTAGAAVDGLTVSDDILDSGVAALELEAGGEGLAIEENLIDGGGYGIYLGGPAYEEVAIAGNVITGPVQYYGIFTGAATIEGFRLTGNTIGVTSDMGTPITDGVVAGNVFDGGTAGEMELQIDLHESTVAGNSFEGNGTTGCLQLFGSQYGLDPSEEVLIAENYFHACNAYAIQLSPEIEAIEITRNAISDSYDGINTRSISNWDVNGLGIGIDANSITGSTHMGIDNTVEGTLDASDNWWGCNGGPGTAGCDTVGTGVEASPYMELTAGASAPEVVVGGGATVTAAVDTDSEGAFVEGVPGTVTFGSSLGSFSTPAATLVGGSAASTFMAGSQPGAAGITVGLDGQQVAVPLNVVNPPPVVPTPPAIIPTPPAPPAGEAKVETSSKPVSVQGAESTLGTISCGLSACQLESKAATAKLGGKQFKLKVIVPATISAGGSGKVKVVLPRSARKALAKAGTGTVTVSVSYVDAAGKSTTRTIRVKIMQKQGR